MHFFLASCCRHSRIITPRVLVADFYHASQVRLMQILTEPFFLPWRDNLRSGISCLQTSELQSRDNEFLANDMFAVNASCPSTSPGFRQSWLCRSWICASPTLPQRASERFARVVAPVAVQLRRMRQECNPNGPRGQCRPGCSCFRIRLQPQRGMCLLRGAMLPLGFDPPGVRG
ncbi:hypothetical protein V5799_013311 [Amblyomma americanum]|uniref:Uncharacterized protein n=1 Tax=Amblyomma americanum TaxID=6943 RepID=A0AAQ4E699_AMBAM